MKFCLVNELKIFSLESNAGEDKKLFRPLASVINGVGHGPVAFFNQGGTDVGEYALLG